MNECQKVKYTTEKFAIEDIDRIRKKSKRQKIPVRAYLCKCGYWHLTSKIDERDIKIQQLNEKIIELTNQIKNIQIQENKQHRYKIKINERVIELNNRIKKQNHLIKKLRAENSKLISKMYGTANNNKPNTGNI